MQQKAQLYYWELQTRWLPMPNASLYMFLNVLEMYGWNGLAELKNEKLSAFISSQLHFFNLSVKNHSSSWPGTKIDHAIFSYSSMVHSIAFVAKARVKQAAQ